EEAAGFGKVAAAAGEFELVFAIGFSGVDGDEVAAAEPGEIGEVEGTERETKIARGEGFLGKVEPAVLGEPVRSEILVIETNGGDSGRRGRSGLLARQAEVAPQNESGNGDGCADDDVDAPMETANGGAARLAEEAGSFSEDPLHEAREAASDGSEDGSEPVN